MSSSFGNSGASARRFATTRWTVVLAAGHGESREALTELCETYWYPLYVFIRRRIACPEEARDLAQAFFANLLERNELSRADPERGRFRSFILKSLENFMANEWDKQRAKKRGGDWQQLNVDFAGFESRFGSGHDEGPAEKLFEKQWAVVLLDNVMDRLRSEFHNEEEPAFERLVEFLGTRPPDGYQALGEELGLTANAVRARVHRLRQRYRKLLREQIAQTVSGPDAVDEEIRDLFAAFAE